jgi:hypothetical protein
MKSNSRGTLAAIAAAATLLLSACAGTPVDFSKRSVTDRSQVDLAKGRKITAAASGFQLLLVIPIGVNGRQESAYQSLLELAGDGVLGDITVTESWTYALVGTVYTTTMEATVYPSAAAAKK